MTKKGKADGRGDRDRRDETGESSPPPRTSGTLVDWIKSFAVAFGLFVVLRFFVVATFVITSGSMESSLLKGDFLLADRMAYGARIPGSDLHLPGYAEPELGDVVVFEPHHDFDGKVVKRIVGVGGDTLAMRDGVLYRNGEPQVEPYAFDSGAPDLHDPEMLWQTEYLVASARTKGYRPTRDDWGPLVVPEGHYFLVGDHRDASYDSRYWGPLAGWRLEARVAAIYFSYDPDALKPFPWVTAARWGRIGRFASPVESEDVSRAPVFRPGGEMEPASSVEQRDLFAAADLDVHVIEDGVHGSAMLLGARTGHDMTGARGIVADRLNDHVRTEGSR